MSEKKLLLDELLKYNKSDVYPFHMPGHKRKLVFPNPFDIDITEIDGFDNLHHPEGILKESMKRAAEVYHSDYTYYLINGSTGGLLSAISAVTKFNGKILIGRNCHKSVYHGVFLNHLKVEYIYPQNIDEYCLCGGYDPEDLKNMLITHPDIQAVLIVSPTYDGVVSNIKKISEIVHQYHIPLIVDEAHGAHFSFGSGFPQSSLDLGADIVIQSIHKTLPSLTQTALLHVKSDYVDRSRLQKYLSIYQSSSPSYVFMASIEQCITIMCSEGKQRLMDLFYELKSFYNEIKKLENLKVINHDIIGESGVYNFDCSKIIISTIGTDLTGIELSGILRNEYRLEMEMCGINHVVAISTLYDSNISINKLKIALFDIDKKVNRVIKEKVEIPIIIPIQMMSIYEADMRKGKKCLLDDCEGEVSKEYVYLYPPGIPFIVPGEIISKEVIDCIRSYLAVGLSVQGPEDEEINCINVVD